MNAFRAKTPLAEPAPLTVVFVVYPDIVLLDLSGPLQVFSHARRTPVSNPAYRIRVVSGPGGRVSTNTILPVDSESIDDVLCDAQDDAIHTVIIVGGDGAIPAAVDAPFVEQFRRLADTSQRVCSVCSGALVLAATGLLDGRRAVTHWEDCEQLEREYPAVIVDPDPIYIKDGNIWTSAGITAGIDMALAIIEEDLGKQAAINMARSLVTPMVRSGGQSQFSPELDRQARDSQGRFGALHNWILDNLQRRITVDDMADACGMSARNFSRRYTETMGISPAKAIEAIRVDAGRDLLMETDKSIKQVATDCGFIDAERMRRAFLRHVKTTPTQYRRQFNASHDSL